MEVYCDDEEDTGIKWVGQDDDWLGLSNNCCRSYSIMYNPDKDQQILCKNCQKWWCVEHEAEIEEVEQWEEANKNKETKVSVFDAIGIYSFLEVSEEKRTLPGVCSFSTPEAMSNFKKGPIIRGLGWVNTVYPKSVAPADQGWLLTGNEKVSRDGGNVYPGEVYEKISWTYDVDSKGTPDSVAKSMYNAVTGVLDYFICPGCKEKM